MKNESGKAWKFICRPTSKTLANNLRLCREATPSSRYALFSHLSHIPRNHGPFPNILCTVRAYVSVEGRHKRILSTAEDRIKRGRIAGDEIRAYYRKRVDRMSIEICTSTTTRELIIRLCHVSLICYVTSNFIYFPR